VKSELIATIIILFFCFCFSVFLSHYTINTDFAQYYSVANKIFDSNAPNISVYDIDTANKYLIPEATEFHGFPYSMFAAYIMAPLALIPYFKAKAAMIFINILMYLAAIAIVLRLAGASGRWFVYPFALFCLWPPFIENMRQGQINAMLLFLIAFAAFAATKNRPNWCGFFLAIAALFKVFPLAIAMVLGIKNWRIFSSCLIAFVISFFIPGSLKWFQAISNNLARYNFLYNPIYSWLQQFSPVWFWVYAFTIASCSALVAYRARDANYPILTSFAIHAVLLIIPIIEYAHLTLLALPYAYIIVSSKRSNRMLRTIVFLSLIMLSIPFFPVKLFLFKIIAPQVLMLLGLFVVWAALAENLFFCHPHGKR
jgi:hypothetical protein